MRADAAGERYDAIIEGGIPVLFVRGPANAITKGKREVDGGLDVSAAAMLDFCAIGRGGAAPAQVGKFDSALVPTYAGSGTESHPHK